MAGRRIPLNYNREIISPIRMSNKADILDETSFWLYSAKAWPSFNHTINSSSNADVASFRVGDYKKKRNQSLAQIGEKNRKNRLAQQQSVVLWDTPIRSIWIKEYKSTAPEEWSYESKLDDAQLRAYRNYINSQLKTKVPEGQEFYSYSNGKEWNLTKYKIQDGLIYETKIDTKWDIKYIKPAVYRATKENLEALQKWYDVDSINKLITSALNSPSYKWLNIINKLPYETEIMLNDKVN